jgi:hypothetical protein
MINDQLKFYPLIEIVRIHAIQSLVGGQTTLKADGEIVFHSGQTMPAEEDIQAELTRMKAEQEAAAYVRNRKLEYPETTLQLEKIYDDGIDKWKSEMVDPVKTKWPKDNSGPVE